jgi:hypothetical protein
LSESLQIYFAFGDESSSQSAAVCVNVPENMTGKEKLLATLAAQLNFPDYFGGIGRRSMNALMIYPGYLSARSF